MQIITGFDTGEFTKKAKEKKLLGEEYVRVLDALAHSLEVGENAFARISKAIFRELVDHKIRRKRKDEVDGLSPLWHSETSFTIDVSAITKHYNKDVVGEDLAKMVGDFSAYLLSTIDPDTAFLVDALDTKIRQVGESLFQFRLKQRWGHDGK